ncbi:MAG: MerR family transcriptional regulator [Limnochordia bacterium]|jgi:DNA-binding transcriptional MerR regulator|nr:MerR family transcriptional regulator [Bacillota bacterium]
MAMKVKEVADLVGVSVRTLHHYDEIGLLKPDGTTASGHRLYSQENLDALQQILFFRELGFPLQEIKRIINSPSFDRREALLLHREMLLEKRRRLDRMLATIDKTLRHMKGEVDMTNEEKFAGFDFRHNPYEEEARRRWGDAAVDKANARIAGREEAIAAEMEAIFEQLAGLRESSPGSPETQAAIKAWYDFLNDNFGDYSPAAFKGLGEMYVADERFTASIDRFGEGLAAFMRDAMAIFAEGK